MKRMDIQVKLTTPCSESRDAMSESRVGYYCHSCQKDVIDFTALSDAALRRVLDELKGKPMCGMFRADQLELPLPALPAQPLWQRAVGRMAASYMLLQSLVHTAVAQSSDRKAVTEQRSTPAATDSFILKGRVIDAYSQLPVDNITTKVIGFEQKSVTDSEGFFTFTISPSTTKAALTITTEPYTRDDGFVIQETSITIAEYRAGKPLVLYRYIGGHLPVAECVHVLPAIKNSYHYGSTVVYTDGRPAYNNVTVINMWKVWDFFAKPFKRKKHAH